LTIVASYLSPAQAELPNPANQDGIVFHVVDHLAWPITLILIVIMVAYNKTLARLFGLSPKIIRKIKAGGVEIELNAEEIDALRSHFTSSIKELTSKSEDEYTRIREYWRIYDYLEHAVSHALHRRLKQEGISKFPRDLRATLYVQDIVFVGYLYQFVDYYPTPTGSVGRRFSQRYGIIGRSWRLQESLGEGDAFATGKGAERTLIEDWGMMRRETQSQIRNRPAYLSVMLRSPEKVFPIGLLYVDSTVPNAFGNDKDADVMAKGMENESEIQELVKKLELAMDPLNFVAPNVDIGR
jgi:hypothetical protein